MMTRNSSKINSLTTIVFVVACDTYVRAHTYICAPPTRNVRLDFVYKTRTVPVTTTTSKPERVRALGGIQMYCAGDDIRTLGACCSMKSPRHSANGLRLDSCAHAIVME